MWCWCIRCQDHSFSSSYGSKNGSSRNCRASFCGLHLLSKSNWFPVLKGISRVMYSATNIVVPQTDFKMRWNLVSLFLLILTKLTPNWPNIKWNLPWFRACRVSFVRMKKRPTKFYFTLKYVWGTTRFVSLYITFWLIHYGYIFAIFPFFVFFVFQVIFSIFKMNNRCIRHYTNCIAF